MAPLGAATVFPIPGDGQSPVTLARAWLTNVQTAEAGGEVRAGLRSIPIRTLAYTALFEDAGQAGQFKALWMNATERLRFIVPLWPRYAIPTAFPDASTIDGAFADRGFVAGAKTAILWQSETLYELLDVDTVADGVLTLSTPVASTFTIGLARVLPVMAAWLEPPTLEQLAIDNERVPVVFREEHPGVAGIDPAVGAAETPVASSITSERLFISSPWGPQKSGAVRVTVFDGAENPIPGAPLTWTVTPNADVTGTPIVTFPGAGDVIAVDYAGNAFAGFTVVVTSGPATLTFNIS